MEESIMNASEIRRRVDGFSTRWVPVTVAAIAGLLWLSSVSWKVPPGFGDSADRCSGLCRFVQAGVDHPVLPGSGWVFDSIVQPQLRVFGYITLVTEAALAALLVSRRYLRVAAVLGIAQSLAIGLAVANAPDEWYWAYLLMIGLHVAVLGFAPDLRPIGSRAMAVVAAIYGVVLLVAHAEAGFTGDHNRTWTLFTGGNDVPDEFGRGTFSGSIALGLVFVALAIAAWWLAGAPDRTRTTSGWILVGVAVVLLFTYHGSGLAIGLGSRAVTAALLAAVGLSLTAVPTPTRPALASATASQASSPPAV
jgi:hypothetical protein